MPHVKTFCRIKPTKQTYEEQETTDNTLYLRVPEVIKDFSSTNKSSRSFINHEFNFDYIFKQDATQEEVFNGTAVDIVTAFLNGYNGTIFAYGQTGTGKTYTVEGNAKTYKSRGLEPRALSLVYKELEKRNTEDLSVHISYLEIYQEVGYDLLNPGARTQSYVTPFPKVNVLEGHNGTCIVRNLSNHLAASEDVAQSLLLQGQANRKVTATQVHDRSSRSHALLTIQLTAKKIDSDTIIRSKLHLVDLAGSERVAKTGVLGQQLNEAKCINLSLHYLEQVIIALQQGSLAKQKETRARTSTTGRKHTAITAGRPSSADGIRGPRHVPYRNSLLTMLLRDSLGGNCMTAMIATISLEISNLSESISTCRFALRVACIANVVSRNEELDEKSLIRKLRKRIAELETELACLKLSQDGGEGDSRMRLTDEDKVICAEVVRQYLSGKVTDPVSAGITNPFKFRECLRILKRVISKGDQNNNHRRNSLSVTLPRHSPTDVENDDVNGELVQPKILERKNVQKLRTEGEEENRVADSVVNTSYYKETMERRARPKPTSAWTDSGPKQRPTENGDSHHATGNGPLQQHMAKSAAIHRTVQIDNSAINRTASAPTGESVYKSNSKQDPETLSQILQAGKPKTPFEQKRVVEIKKLGTKVDKIQTERIEKEQEVLDLKIQVAEKELDLMERHMRTKLAVTTSQVEDQRAYVKQLASNEADPELLGNEKLVEKQLRKRMGKCERQLEYIEYRREQLKTHTGDGLVVPEKKASVNEKFGQFRKRDGSMNTRQVFQMLQAEEKNEYKERNKVDREKILASANLMEMKELSTRQRLKELKEAMKSGSAYVPIDPQTYASMNGHANNQPATNQRVPTNGDKIERKLNKQNSNEALTRENTFVVNGDDKNPAKTNDNPPRPSSSASVQSNNQVPNADFYAKRKQGKDPTSRWESNYSRPTTPSNLKITDPETNDTTKNANNNSEVNVLKIETDKNSQEPTEERFYHADRNVNRSSKPETKKTEISDDVLEAQSRKLEEELFKNKNRKFREQNKALYEQKQRENVKPQIPSEYVYGMSNTEQFDARKMDLSSQNFDSALNTMLNNDNSKLFPENGNYEQYARTSKYRPNPYLENPKPTPPSRQRSKQGQREREGRPRQREDRETKTPEKKTRGDADAGGSPISAKISRYLNQSTGKDKTKPRQKERVRPSSADSRPVEGYDMSKFLLTNPHSLFNKSQGDTVQIEDEHHGRITAMEEQERETRFMTKAQTEKTRVNRIRKAQKSAEIIQRSWRKFMARKRRR